MKKTVAKQLSKRSIRKHAAYVAAAKKGKHWPNIPLPISPRCRLAMHLKCMRLQSKANIESIAKFSHLTARAYLDVEEMKDFSNPDVEQITKLAAFYGKDISYLFGMVDPNAFYG